MQTNRAMIQERLCNRAHELAIREGFQGPGKFAPRHYRLALAERSPEEREIERGLTRKSDGSPAALASRHCSEEIQKYVKQGVPHRDAVTRALSEEHPALKARRAGFDPTISLDAGQAALCRMFNATAPPMRAYAASRGVGETVTDAARAVGRDVLVRQIAASVLHRGNSAPDQYERSFADDWYGVHFPPPPPVSGGQDLGDHNRQRLAFVESVLADARRLLADPAARTQISPRPLNG